jgi:hypothetical protein
MNKIIVLGMILLGGLAQLFAEAPELRHVMPNSWKKVTRLLPAEETAFLQANKAIEDAIKMEFKFDLHFSYPPHTLEHTLVYQQTAGNDEFYRMVLTYEQEPDFISGRTSFVQGLVYKNRSGKNTLLVIGAYKRVSPTQSNAVEQYHSIDLMESREKAKGILVSTVVAEVDYDENDRVMYQRYIKGQPSGEVLGFYILMDWIGDNVAVEHPSRGIGSEYLPANTKYIEIGGSECLIDSRSPLRYGLASAFDNDPSTSYVENTEDDLMSIKIYIGPEYFRHCMLINGYAQDATLYKNNNRIKSLWIGDTRRELLDNTLAYQYLDCAFQSLYVSDIYKGTKYNDSCLAEYNVYVDEIGWLFGDINE